jgi:hypothetical protein
MIRACVAISVFLGASVGTSAAQDPPGQAQASGASTEMASVIKALSGRWTVTGQFEPSAELPRGGPISGVQTWRPGPGGFTFMQEEDLHAPMGEMFGTGFMWWDQSRGFAGLRCLNLDPHGCDVAGSTRIRITWDRKALTIDFLNSKDTTKISWHEVFSDITTSSFVQTGYTGDAAGTLHKTLSIRATRVGR